jgi:hypothetical protein
MFSEGVINKLKVNPSTRISSPTRTIIPRPNVLKIFFISITLRLGILSLRSSPQRRPYYQLIARLFRFIILA